MQACIHDSSILEFVGNTAIKASELQQRSQNFRAVFALFAKTSIKVTYFQFFTNSGFQYENHYSSCISYLLDLYAAKTDTKILSFISLFVQSFYNQLSLENSSFVSSYQKNLNKILYLINNMKKFHLDKKNLIFTIDKIIKNER